MALQANLQLDSGLLVNDAYLRINRLGGNKEKISLSVTTYVSQQHFLDGLAPLSEHAYNFTPNVEQSSENFIKQGYEYLKSLDEYTNAIDV